MKKIGIFYGSTTGDTEKIAKRIGEALGVPPENVFNVKETSPSKVGDFDVLILGSSTWGSGELQEDWYDFLDGLQALSLKDKEIAIFGCGDENMSDSFCNAVGIIYRRLLQSGAKFIGDFSTSGYSFEESKAKESSGMAVGLLIDETNHPELTRRKISEWCDELNNRIK